MSRPTTPSEGAAPYDALLVVSFGGPEGPDDVLPFLDNVTRGRGVPRERLEAVAEHYHAFGGRSPINDQCRALVAAIRADLSGHGVELPVYWGNRNWDPYLADTLAQMQRDGVVRAACFVTSAYSSYSGCRRYREDLFEAVAETGAGAPWLDKLRHYYNHPGFVRPFVDGTVDALRRLAGQQPASVRLVFVTHSIPRAMDAVSALSPTFPLGGGYVAQHTEVARLVADAVAERTGTRLAHDLVYCSRSGPASVPWLEPDVGDHLERLAADGVDAVVAVPIGFVSDHMEVVHDLDTEAGRTAGRLGLGFARVPTPGTDPRFVAMVRELLVERAATERAGDAAQAGDLDLAGPARVTIGRLGASWDVCPAGCCRTLRAEQRPALCGADSPEQVVP